MEVEDAGCARALEQALGHPGPFSSEELAGLEELTVVHARELDALEACTGLRRLRLLGCEVPDLLFCAELTELRHLEVFASAVESFTGPSLCEQLERVDLLFTSIANAGDLLGIPVWRRGAILGNPWPATGYEALASGVDDGPQQRVDLAPAQEHKVNLALWQAAGLCSGRVGGRDLVVRPGLPVHTSNQLDAVELPALSAQFVLEQHVGTAGAADAAGALGKWFAQLAAQVVALGPAELSELASAREVGVAADAQRWLAERGSGLTADEVAAIDRLLQRFPGVAFFRTEEQVVRREGAALSLPLPAWYLEQRGRLDGWAPRLGCPPVRFDAFEGATPRASRAGALTFDLGLREPAAEVKDALARAQLAPIAVALEEPELYLAISLDGTDRAIYDYHEEDLRDAQSEGRDPKASITQAFPSYAAMLGHIVSLHPHGGEVVSAQA